MPWQVQSHIVKGVVLWNVPVSTACPAAGAGLPSAYLASHDILETAGLHAHGSPGALYGMLEWCCADGLSA